MNDALQATLVFAVVCPAAIALFCVAGRKIGDFAMRKIG